jgi:hypothetical protein
VVAAAVAVAAVVGFKFPPTWIRLTPRALTHLLACALAPRGVPLNASVEPRTGNRAWRSCCPARALVRPSQPDPRPFPPIALPNQASAYTPGRPPGPPRWSAAATNQCGPRAGTQPSGVNCRCPQILTHLGKENCAPELVPEAHKMQWNSTFCSQTNSFWLLTEAPLAAVKKMTARSAGYQHGQTARKVARAHLGASERRGGDRGGRAQNRLVKGKQGNG